MIGNLKLEFENFYNSSANFMFVDCNPGVGKSLFAKGICEDINRINSDSYVLLSYVPNSANLKEFVISLIRAKNDAISRNINNSVFHDNELSNAIEKEMLRRKYENMSKSNLEIELKSFLLAKLSQCKILVIHDSQNLLISNSSMVNHFLLMSWIVEQTNIKVLYLGTQPFRFHIEYQNLVNVNKRSVHYSMSA